MTEMIEGVMLALPVMGKDKCPICEKAPHPQRTTQDKKDGKGCLKSIPANLGCAALPPLPDLPSYATAAHHLIPANQCLKSFQRLSQMCDCVGYDVNNAANGLSLPTCGQQSLNRYRTAAGGTAKYGDLDLADKKNAAFVIMQGLNRQWHVGHHDWALDLETDGAAHVENYDKLVKVKLRDLEKDIRSEGDSICEPPDDSESGSAIIAELNALSAEIQGQVLAWRNYFVSTMSWRYARKYK